MSVYIHIITTVKKLEALNFHVFASLVEIAKINCRWNFVVVQYIINLAFFTHSKE